LAVAYCLLLTTLYWPTLYLAQSQCL